MSVAVNGTAPHDLDAERSVLGTALLIEGAPRCVVDAGLRSEDFYFERHGLIYEAMVELHGRGAAVTRLTVSDELERRGNLDKVGGRAGVAELEGLVSGLAAVGDHAHLIRERAQWRRDRRAAQAFIDHPSADTRQGAIDALTALSQRRRVVTASEFIAKPRQPLDPDVTGNGGRSVLLAAGTALGVAGPSGLGKTLAVIDLAGLLASDCGGRWLGLQVSGARRVLLVVLEGAEEDIAERVSSLVPQDARDRRLFIDDRWAADRTVPTVADIAAAVREHEIDVVFIDTLGAFFEDRYDTSVGIPEQAHRDFEAIRRLSGRNVAFVGSMHTRKRDRAAGTVTDELEELAGTFHKKLDAAVVIRADGDGSRRRVIFAKIRRGPQIDTVIAALPSGDADEPPRLRIVAEAASKLREGTEAERIAEWIESHDEPQSVAAITAALDIGDSTLRRRRKQLDGLGMRHAPIPGRARTHGYGTVEQWRNAGAALTEDGE